MLFNCWIVMRRVLSNFLLVPKEVQWTKKQLRKQIITSIHGAWLGLETNVEWLFWEIKLDNFFNLLKTLKRRWKGSLSGNYQTKTCYFFCKLADFGRLTKHYFHYSNIHKHSPNLFQLCTWLNILFYDSSAFHTAV